MMGLALQFHRAVDIVAIWLQGEEKQEVIDGMGFPNSIRSTDGTHVPIDPILCPQIWLETLSTRKVFLHGAPRHA